MPVPHAVQRYRERYGGRPVDLLQARWVDTGPGAVIALIRGRVVMGARVGDKLITVLPPLPPDEEERARRWLWTASRWPFTSRPF